MKSFQELAIRAFDLSKRKFDVPTSIEIHDCREPPWSEDKGAFEISIKEINGDPLYIYPGINAINGDDLDEVLEAIIKLLEQKDDVLR